MRIIKETNNIRFQIHKKDGRTKFAVTDEASWFIDLKDAEDRADKKAGETIWQYDTAISTTRPMWEIF